MTTHRRDDIGPRPAGSDSSVKDQAADTAEAGKQAAADVAGTAADAAKDVAQQTSQQARDLVGKTRTQVNEQVSTQQSAVVDNLRSLGDQLAEMTDHVDQQGTAVDLAAAARDRVRSAADWLDGRDPGEVLDELRRLGRNKPGAFLLGSAVAGVVAGRLTRGVVAMHTDDEPVAKRDEMLARPRPELNPRPVAGPALPSSTLGNGTAPR